MSEHIDDTDESGVVQMTVDQSQKLAFLKLWGLVNAAKRGDPKEELYDRIDGIGTTFIRAHAQAAWEEGFDAGAEAGQEDMFKSLVRANMLRVRTRAGLARALDRSDQHTQDQLLAWFDEAIQGNQPEGEAQL